jgi:hypothetical protein
VLRMCSRATSTRVRTVVSKVVFPYIGEVSRWRPSPESVENCSDGRHCSECFDRGQLLVLEALSRISIACSTRSRVNGKP